MTTEVLVDNLGRIVGKVAPRTGQVGMVIKYTHTDNNETFEGYARITRYIVSTGCAKKLVVFDGNTGRGFASSCLLADNI